MTSALPVLAVALGALLLLGLAFGFGSWLGGRRPVLDPNELMNLVGLPDALASFVEAAPGAAILVSPHDEVLKATEPAIAAGLVRGSRIAVAPLLELVRSTRRELRRRDVNLQVTRVAGGPSSQFEVRLAPVKSGFVLILAEDHSEAQRVDATRRDFVANVSHELKTPIGAISLLSEALIEAADEPDAVRNFAARMQQESVRLGELVTQIIDLSRIQAENPLRRADLVGVDEVVAAAVARCRSLAEARQVSLTTACPEGLEVLGDFELLVDAVANLVHNAIVYSEPTARVAVAVVLAADAEYVEISVTDNGIGIAEADQKRIFERFYRVDYARSRANGGTGLGLSIVSHIASSHGGKVSVWSRLGQGSTFTILLPLAAQPSLVGADSIREEGE